MSLQYLYFRLLSFRCHFSEGIYVSFTSLYFIFLCFFSFFALFYINTFFIVHCDSVPLFKCPLRNHTSIISSANHFVYVFKIFVELFYFPFSTSCLGIFCVNNNIFVSFLALYGCQNNYRFALKSVGRYSFLCQATSVNLTILKVFVFLVLLEIFSLLLF